MADAWDYARGVAQGLADCGKTGQDLLAAAASMARGDFVTAANLLGLKPGESITLRTIYQEATTQTLGVSPFEAGRIAGRRLCSYAMIPAGLKALKAVRTAGVTKLNPLKGSAIADAVSGDAAAPAGKAQLPGKWIETKNGPVQIGKLRGSAHSATSTSLPAALDA